MDKKTIAAGHARTLPAALRTYGAWRAFGAGIVCLTLLVLFGCEREVAVPQQITGKWTSSAPDYADRYMKFTKDTLTYGIGNNEEISHRIKSIERVQLGNKTAFTFHYRDAEGDKAFLTVSYTPDDGGTLHIKNDTDGNIWKKADL